MYCISRIVAAGYSGSDPLKRAVGEDDVWLRDCQTEAVRATGPREYRISTIRLSIYLLLALLAILVTLTALVCWFRASCASKRKRGGQSQRGSNGAGGVKAANGAASTRKPNQQQQQSAAGGKKQR